MTASAAYDSAAAKAAGQAAEDVESAAVPQTQPAMKAATHYALPPKFPQVQIRKLDLQASSISLRDAARGGAAPLELRDVRFRNLEPIMCLGKQPDSQPPMRLQLTAAVKPVAEQVTVDLTASPFALHSPHAMIDLAVHGINGRGLTELRPDLAERIDGSNLKEGTFSAHLWASTKWTAARRWIFRWRTRRMWTCCCGMSNTRPTRMGRCSWAWMNCAWMMPASTAPQPRSRSRVLRPPSPYCTLPAAQRASAPLGLLVKLPAASQPAGTPATEQATPAAGSPPRPAKAKNQQPPGMVARIRKFTISGVDALYEDRSAALR